MFSALKKLTTSGRPDAAAPPGGSVPMSDTLQKKFARGVQYNMKIILKGDRNVGKTCLLQRLQGGAFLEAYTPSDEIQVASIQWSFRPSEADVVKVEVWDVVDRGKARAGRAPPSGGGLKLHTAGGGGTGGLDQQPALDAEFLDVYKGTHGVVLLFDITKAWTFEYVCRELPRIPQDIPVLILGNHCDMAHHRCVSAGQVIGLIEGCVDRPAEIHFGDSSMRNGFGLRLLHRFLGLPFLRLQRETLLSQLQRNQRDTQSCSGDLTAFLQSDDADYGKFIDQLSSRRRQIADANPKALSHSGSATSIASAASVGGGVGGEQQRPLKSIVIGGGQPIVIPGTINVTNEPRGRPPQQQSQATLSAAVTPTTTTNTSSMHTTLGFMSQLMGGGAKVGGIATTVVSVDEFCPEGGGGLDRGFLDDESTTAAAPAPIITDDSDSDAEATANPLVARFHDEPAGLAADSPLHLAVAEPVAKVNPLAKGAGRQQQQQQQQQPSMARKLSTTSSDDPEVPAMLNAVAGLGIRADDDDDGVDTLGDLRRSPEGLEDPACMQSAARPEPVSTTLKTASGDEEPSSAGKSSSSHHRSGKKHKKERHETKAERDVRRAEKKAKRHSRSGKTSGRDSDPDESTASQHNIDSAYEAL